MGSLGALVLIPGCTVWYVKYNIGDIPQADHLYLAVRYSKNSPSTTSIQIYIDDEPTPRNTFIPVNQGNWNQFTETSVIDLGNVGAEATQ